MTRRPDRPPVRSVTLTAMTTDLLSPGDLTARMSGNGLPMTDRTVRRMAEAYEVVYGPLPRDPRRNFRMFPPEAADRLEQGARTLRANPGASMEDVLTSQRDGLPMHQTAHPVAADGLTPILDELRALRSDVADLRALVAALVSGTAAPAIAPAPATATRTRKRPVTKLQKNHAELLERLKAGSALVQEGGKTQERTPDGELHRVDPRTVEALERYGMLKLDHDGVYRITDNPLLPA